MIEAETQIADRLWEFTRMERQYRVVGEQALQSSNDLLRFIEERKSRQRSLPKVRPTDRAAYVQRACDVVLALDQLTPRSRYVQAGALYAANALSGEALRALADEGSVSLENFQELFDLAGEALRLYDEVTFTRPGGRASRRTVSGACRNLGRERWLALQRIRGGVRRHRESRIGPDALAEVSPAGTGGAARGAHARTVSGRSAAPGRHGGCGSVVTGAR